MPTRQTILAEAQQLVGTAAFTKGVAALASYADLALRDLNRYSPRHVKTVLTGDGTDEYELGQGWHDRFSVVERVRWVASADFDSPAVWLEREDYEIEYARRQVTNEAVGTGDGSTKTFSLDEDFAIQPGAAVTVNAAPSTAFTIAGGDDGSAITFTTAPTTGHAIVASYYVTPPQIRFFYGSPAAADRVVVEHTARHVLSDAVGTTTLSDDEAGALAHRLAALFLRACAAATAGLAPQNTDTDFIGPAVGTAGDAFRRLADDEDARFFAMLGIGAPDPGTGRAPGAPSVVVVPSQPNRRNNWYITHPRRGGASWLA